MPLLSIITPAYNRAHLLHNCFDSLVSQSCMDFEWIIIDDGSVDNTEEVVRSFSTELFSIVYEKKENGGKHTALNASHPYIHGDYILILDSDDTLTPDAVETALAVWSDYRDDPSVSLLSFYKQSPDGIIVSSRVEQERLLSDHFSYQVNQRKDGDQCEVVRSSYFKEFAFPVFPGERFASEGLLWNYLGYKYKAVYVDKAIYNCEYLEGGLTDSGRRLLMSNPKAMIELTKTFFDPRVCLRVRVKESLLYVVYSFCDHRSFGTMMQESKQKLLTGLMYPGGAVLYYYWKKRYLM